MDSALAVHRLHFAFTVTFHYLFPQLTMGLALLIVVLKTMALRTGNEHFNSSARFWAKIFAINFAMGVVTGIPMEFQFGTNWSRFSKSAGGVLGQTLAMEGVFSFFLESSFLGLFLFGEKMLGRIGHWIAAALVWLGSWLSGFFIVATDAWMQHPVGYSLGPSGEIRLESFWGLIFNPWVFWQYLHTMLGAVATASFVMAGVGAFYVLMNRRTDFGRTFLRVGVISALISSVLLLFPTGDGQGKNVARYQPTTLAATEGLFETLKGAPMAIMGQPDTNKRRLDNPFLIPNILSFITYGRWSAEVKGLDAFPREDWPDNMPLLYYSFHIMVGLGTIFIAITVICSFALWRGTLFTSRPLLWILMLAVPFPYISNTAGWLTAELGRQPWLIYGVMRTSDGASPYVSAGNALFTLIGFMGMYTILSILFLFLVYRELEHGPDLEPVTASAVGSPGLRDAGMGIER
jgi:cytochrome d ubiquinol oxidase subunit I